MVERRGAIVPHVCGRAVPKCRGQRFVDGRFEREDFGDAKSLLHLLGIESLKVPDALLQPLYATPLLFGGEDRCFGLWGLAAADGTTGHAVSLGYVISSRLLIGTKVGFHSIILSTSSCVRRSFVRS